MRAIDCYNFRLKPGPLEDGLWKSAENAFDKEGAAALVQHVGFNAYTSLFVNGYAVPLPDGERTR